MAWPISFDKFLWTVDLKYGIHINGGLYAAMTLFFLFNDQMAWYEYLWWLFGVVPMAVLFILLLISVENKGYIKANWYFAFVSYCIGAFYTIVSTIYIAIMISTLNSWGEKSIETESESDPAELLAYYAGRSGNAYRAMPDSMQALFHDGQDENYVD